MKKDCCLFCHLPEMCQCQVKKLIKRICRLRVHVDWLRFKLQSITDYTARQSCINQMRASLYEIKTIKADLKNNLSNNQLIMF